MVEMKRETVAHPRRQTDGGRSRPFAAALVELVKVRLTGLVVATAAVGYMMAPSSRTDWGGLAWTLLGTWLAAAGAMALNQYLEADRDALMEQTKNRPLPSGEIEPWQAAAVGLGSALAGVLLLVLAVNVLTGLLAAFVVALYTLVYTPMKTRTPVCTLVGAVCGAIPPVMGWTGATASVAFGALFLAVVLFVWQIPHFLALAWLYRDDYERAGFRMLPVLDANGKTTAFMAVLYTAALLPVAVAGWLSGIAGAVYGAGSLLFGAAFLGLSLRLRWRRSADNARRLFLASLAYLPLLLALLLADRRCEPVSAKLASATRARVTASALPSRGTGTSHVSVRSRV